MSRYGSGLSYGQIANMEKERIKHALEGEKCIGEDEDGNFIWTSCSDEEADDEIIAVFDEAVYQVLDALHTSRAMETIAKAHGYDGNIKEFQDAMAETDMVSEYVFEGDPEDVPENELCEEMN